MMIRLGLRTKFFLYSNTVIVITASLVVGVWINHARAARYAAVERRARSITEGLAVPLAEVLPWTGKADTTWITATNRLIAEVIRHNRDLLKYVIVCDRRGRVISSNRHRLLGESFPRAPDIRPFAVHMHAILDTDGQRVLEVRMPLVTRTGPIGTLAAGFSLVPVEATMKVIAKRALLVAFLLIVGNSIVTAIYVESLIRPILALNATMKRAGTGELSIRADESRSDEVGELARVFNSMMDELQQAQEAARIHAAQLAHTEKMAAVGTLAAGVAHEVNNPLAGIMNCVDSLAANPDDTELRNRYLGLIHDGLKRIEKTVHNLLEFSRPRKLRPTPTPLNHSVTHVLELVTYQLHRENIRVRLELDPQGATVIADHFQMEQLLLNLVLNAVNAMPEGGLLTIRTRTVGANVTVDVCDTGVGIPDEIRNRIFDPFFTTQKHGKGTGLGLAVSHRIVQAHGGRIEVESREGHGTTMRVVLPKDGTGERGEG